MKKVIRLNQKGYKERLIETGIFQRVNSSQYRCNCPYCGDRKKHMYVFIKLTDDSPVLYNCFKCNASGIMNKTLLEYLGIEDINIPKQSFGKHIDMNSTASAKMSMVTVNEKCNIDCVCEYINNKVGHYPTLNELQYFQYVGDPVTYAMEYLGYKNKDTNIFKNRNWFRLTNGNIAGRWVNDNNDLSWLKFKSNNVKGRGLYTIKLPFDLYQPINVYITEGIMDVIGLYYNYKKDDNCIYIATMGKHYENGIKHLVSMGIFGTSVNIKIFKDSDVKVSDIYIDKYLRKLFNKIDIYQNTIGHDYGMLPNEIDIQKVITNIK
jgi:hypothetical protein